MIKKILLSLFLFMVSVQVALSINTTDNDAYWAFDNNFTDSSLNGNNATNNGAAFVGGIIEEGIIVDGSTDFVDLTAPPTIGTGDISFSFWINSNSSSLGWISGVREDASNNGRIDIRANFDGTVTNSGFLQFVLQQDNANSLTAHTTTSVNFNDGNWHHLVVIFNNTNNDIVLFKDGVKQGITMDSTMALNMPAITRGLYLGGFNNAGSLLTPYPAAYDEFSIWNSALTEDNVSELYSGGVGFNPYTIVLPTQIIFSNPTNNSYLNNNSFLLNVSFSEITNSTYKLNSGAEINLGNNTNNVSLTLFPEVVAQPTIFISPANRTIFPNQVNANQYCSENYGGTSSNFTVIDTEISLLTANWTGSSWTEVSSQFSILEVTCVAPEGLNNLTVFTNTSGSLSNSSISFTVDTINPIITNNMPLNTSSYFVDFNGTTCTDTNLQSCNISMNNQNLDLLTINNLTSTLNGNISYNITATDLAGNNVTETGVVFINPTISFSFLNDGVPITGYSFGGRQSEGDFVNYSVYNDGLILGNNTLLFSKNGFIAQNFTFSVNESVDTNFSFNVTPSFIIVNLFDRATENNITTNTSIQLIGALGDIITTTTGQGIFQAINLTPGDYQIIASNSLYQTETKFFTYSTQENITLNVFMIANNESNLGSINIQVKDTLSFLVEDATVNLLEWKPSLSSFITVSQCQTNINGICILNIELNDKLYKFQAIKDGAEKTTNSQIISIDQQTVTITLEDIALEAIDDLSTIVFSATETINNNLSTVRLQYTDTGGVLSQACITSFKDTGFSQIQLSQNCSSSNSGILFQTNNINNTFDLIIRATITIDGVEYLVEQFIHKSTADISVSLEDYNLDIIIPVIFLFIGLGAGLFFGNIYISLTLIIFLEWVATVIAPSVISVSIAVVITVVGLLTFWGVSRK